MLNGFELSYVPGRLCVAFVGGFTHVFHSECFVARHVVGHAESVVRAFVVFYLFKQCERFVVLFLVYKF